MRALRSVICGSPRRRGLLVFGLLLTLIAGLLGMHVLSVSGPHGSHVSSIAGAANPAADARHAAAGGAHGMTGDGAAGDASSQGTAFGHAGCDDCGAPAPAPNHSMLMIGCVLALLAGLVLLIARRPLGRAWTARLPGLRLLVLPGTVLPPSPTPSLVVLSISRT